MSKYLRKNNINLKYLKNISELVGITPREVELVFEYYILYMLHEIATAPKPKKTQFLHLPGFCSFLLRENKRKGAKNRLEIYLRPETRDEYFKEILEDAYFKDKDPLIDCFIQDYIGKLKDIYEE